MLNRRRFQKNLALWAHLNPKPAVYLPYLDCQEVKFCKTKQGELNLKIGKRYLHSSTNALKESQKWFAKLKLFQIDVIYVFGVGLGYYYDAAKEWLKQDSNRRLIFLENDLSVIHRLFETEKGTKILLDSQVKLHYFDNLEDSETVLTPLSDLYWETLTTRVLVTGLKFYKKTKQNIFDELHHKIIFDISMLHSILGEYLDYGYNFYLNFYSNVLCLSDAYLASGLFNKFRDLPAIICGAGPSLNQQLPILKELKDKALIFAGGSSLNALNYSGMQPHLGAGVDPNFPQLERIQKNSAFEVPFLYRNRFYHPALKQIHAPCLYIPGSGGYDTSEWIEEKFEIDNDQFIDEGFNVVNLCLSLAHAFGCNPIIFVGMDLAYTHLHKYAEGIDVESSVKKNEILETEDFNAKAILRKDIYGKPIYTLWKWIAESNWISVFAKTHPKITLINATEGGLGFHGIPNEPFAGVVDTYLTNSYDIAGWLHGEIQNNALSHISKKALQQVLEELRESMERCKTNIKLILEETEKMIEHIKNKKKMPETLQSGAAALYEIELSEEPGYSAVLEMFNLMCSKVLNREVQALRTSHRRLPDWKKAIKKLEINSKKLIFLYNVSEMNAQLISKALENGV